MESSEILPQPGPGEIEPNPALHFEVVRRGEFVFEPFMGSLIQLPEIRMQRAQSSEFFLAQSSTNTEKDDVEAPLVWERPRPVTQASASFVPSPTEQRPAIPSDTRKAKAQKSPKEQDAPRFYQPPIVRFFDPVAAAAEGGEETDAAELPGPRASTQLSPELKAAILRIDEQRRQMQQDAKQEKPAKGKKRGVLKAKSARAADNPDVPIEIVKPRDVVITERAARWEEISAPPRPAEPEVLPKPATAGPALAMAIPAADQAELVAASSPLIPPVSQVPPMAEPIAATPFASPAEDVPVREAIPIYESVSSPPAEQQPEVIRALAHEAAAPEEIFSTPQNAPVHETLREPEIVSTQEAVSTHDAIPLDTDVALPLAAQTEETITDLPREVFAAEEGISTPEFARVDEYLPEPEFATQHEATSTQEDVSIGTPVAPLVSAQPQETLPAPEQEAFVEEEVVPTLEFALSDVDLYEPEIAAIPEAARPSTPTPAMPSSSVAYAAKPAAFPLAPAAPVGENHPLPAAFAAHAPTATPADTEENGIASEPQLTRRVRGIAAAIARLRRADLVFQPVEAPISQAPFEEEPFEEERPRPREKLSLATRLQRWLGGETANLDGNRRRADRTIMPGLVAFYWSGGSPRPHEIVNISKTGFYLKTKEFWSIETLVRMTLQRPPAETTRKGESISVLARVVRIDEGGVGHEFVTTEALMHARSMDVMPSHGTDTRALDKFLQIQ